jgi:hypothetical protein
MPERAFRQDPARDLHNRLIGESSKALDLLDRTLGPG